MANQGEFKDAIERTIDLLKSCGVTFEAGLSDHEAARCEDRFGFSFPADLKALLQTALPVGIASDRERHAFPDWRSGSPDDLRERLEWPFDGMVFDIELNAFWLEEWGERPSNVKEAIAVARRHFEDAPRLIPVYAHRYLPSEPLIAGNPVFSVYQTDIIIYGVDVWDYFRNEFARGGDRLEVGRASRVIRFWSALAQ